MSMACPLWCNPIIGKNMATETDSAPKQEVQPPEPKIMCYVSKEMVPLSKTVEVDYGGGKTFRVLPKYVKFQTEISES